MKDSDKFLILIMIILIGIISFFSIIYLQSEVFSNKWNGYSEFSKISKEKTNTQFYTIFPDKIRMDDIILNKKNNSYIFKNDTSNKNIILFTNAYPWDNSLKNYLIINFLENNYHYGNKIYDINSEEKRDDLIVGDYQFKNNGKIIFRFPHYYYALSEINKYDLNETVISKTKKSSYVDINNNEIIDNKDINSEFALIKKRKIDNIEIYSFNNPSLFQNDLINKYDNKQFAKELLIYDETKIVYEDSPNFIKELYYIFLEFRRDITFEFLIYFCLFSLLLFLIINSIHPIYMVIKEYSFKEKKVHEFYDVLNDICTRSFENSYFYKWILIMQLNRLRDVLLSKYNIYENFSKNNMDNILRTNYPSLFSINLKMIILCLDNNNEDFVVGDEKTVKSLCNDINYVINVIKRGY